MEKAQRIKPDHALLVVVDMQNDFCDPKGERYIPGVEKVAEKISGLLKAARQKGVRIIFTQSWRPRDLPQYTVFGRKPALIEGSWNSEFIDSMKPREGETVIRKFTHDCFYKTNMDSYLSTLGQKPWDYNVVVTGVASNICVYHAVMGFHERFYNVLVPTDCIKANTEEQDKFTLSQFSHPAYNFNIKLTRSELVSFGA